MDWTSLLFLAAIVAFWAVVFFSVLYMTRRSLRGVGELPIDDAVVHAAPGVNGHIPAATQAQTQVTASGNGSATAH
jgi:hypothetical protein